VWLPSESADRVCGLEQEDQLPPSIWHSKLEPDSLELKLKLGVALPDGFAGFESMVVFGAVRSTVHM
jgi:hypothetical protein